MRSRPFLAKSFWRVEKLLNGAGMSDKVSEAIEILPSLLPVGTFQKGPPYNNI